MTLLIAAAVVLFGASPGADPVAVLHPEGALHGFLVIRSADDKPIATGDLVQEVRRGRVTSRLTFHFTDGSLQDETAVFLQNGRFRLLTDHLVQRGPSFPRSLDMWIDTRRASVRVRYVEDGHPREVTDHIEVADLANGLIITLLKNVPAGSQGITLPFVAATPKPRSVKLVISSAGTDAFSLGSERRQAIHYVVHVDLGGITGAIADLFGKQPPDSHVWVLGGAAPAFLKAEQPFFPGGPLWRIELAAPAWRAARAAR